MAVIEENWNYRIELNSVKNGSYREFESSLLCLYDEILNKNCFKIQKYGFNNVHSHEEELKRLLEENKQLRNEIDIKLEELTKQKVMFETYKKDQKLFTEEIKGTHEAFLMAKKYYKKYAKIYYTIEARNGDKHIIFVQFFTEAKKDTDLYSVRIQRDIKTEHYELLDTKPQLKNIKELKQNLLETKDLPGTLYIIRQAFLTMKEK